MEILETSESSELARSGNVPSAIRGACEQPGVSFDAMAKVWCPCGWGIPDSGDYNVDKAVAVRDWDYSRLLSSTDFEHRMRAVVDAFREAGEKELFHQVLSAALNVLWERQLDMFECTQCGRIAIEKEPDSNRFRFFTPESTDRGVFHVDDA
jgi:hypothetical protein